MFLVELSTDVSSEAATVIARLASRFDVRQGSPDAKIISVYLADEASPPADLDQARRQVGAALDEIDANWRDHLSIRGE